MRSVRQRLEERHHELVEVRRVGPVRANRHDRNSELTQSSTCSSTSASIRRRSTSSLVDVRLLASPSTRRTVATRRSRCRRRRRSPTSSTTLPGDPRRRDRRAQQQRLEPGRELGDEIAPVRATTTRARREPRRPSRAGTPSMYARLSRRTAAATSASSPGASTLHSPASRSITDPGTMRSPRRCRASQHARGTRSGRGRCSSGRDRSR